MRKKNFMIVIQKDEDGVLVASCPTLRGCHTQARSMNALIPRMKEAIELCLEVEGSSFKPMDFVGLQEIQVN